MMQERIHKYLAKRGLGSNRQIENLIRMGRIYVNGQVATLGQAVGERDKIVVDGKLIAPVNNVFSIKTRMLLYHKPVGEICSRDDPSDISSVFDSLPSIAPRDWILIGRLDVQTSGVLLLTNDGQLAHLAMHPSSEIPREYLVRVFGDVMPEHLTALKKGVLINGHSARFNNIRSLGDLQEEAMNQSFFVTLYEGRNREVRALWESQGLKVSRLKRVSYGSVRLEKSLRKGCYRELTDKEISQFRQGAKKGKKYESPE